MTDWSWVKLGSLASRAASRDIAVIDYQRKVKAELLLVMLTAVVYCSLPQENSDQPLVFQVTRVSSVALNVLRGVQRFAPPKTVGLHWTAQVMRIWRGSVTDSNITTFPEADATHMDLLSGATWSVHEHSLTKWTCVNVSDSEMLNISPPPDQKCRVLIIAKALQLRGWTPVHREVTHARGGPLEFSTSKWSSRRP